MGNKKLNSCEDCYHWTWYTTTPGGYCGIYSVRCANYIAEGKAPPRFLSFDEVEEEYIVGDNSGSPQSHL